MHQHTEVSIESTRFVDVSKVLEFVERTRGHGVPLRIAIKRAARKYGADEGLIRSFVRSA